MAKRETKVVSDSELLTALGSEDPALFRKADAEFMRGADPAKARRFLALLYRLPRSQNLPSAFVTLVAAPGRRVSS